MEAVQTSLTVVGPCRAPPCLLRCVEQPMGSGQCNATSGINTAPLQTYSDCVALCTGREAQGRAQVPSGGAARRPCHSAQHRRQHVPSPSVGWHWRLGGGGCRLPIGSQLQFPTRSCILATGLDVGAGLRGGLAMDICPLACKSLVSRRRNFNNQFVTQLR